MAEDRTAFFRSLVPRFTRDILAAVPEWGPDDVFADLGNAGHESGGFKQLQEIKPLVPGSAGGYGPWQWTGPRRTQFMNYCKQHNLATDSYPAWLGFHLYELRNTEKAAIPRTAEARGLDAKCVAFELGYERASPKYKHYESRQKWARIAKAAYEAEKPIAPSIKAIATTAAVSVPVGAPTAVSHFHFSPIAVIVTIGFVVIAGGVAFVVHIYLRHRNSQRTIEGIAEEINMDPHPETTGTDAGSVEHEERSPLDELRDRVESHFDDFPDIKLKDLPRILDIFNTATQKLGGGLPGPSALSGLSALQGATPIATPQATLDGKPEGMLSSTTIQGIIISVASKILAVTVGLTVPAEAQTQLAIILAGFAPDLIGNAMSFYGRLKAKSKIKVGG